MTTEATLPATTSASPTARQVWTRARGVAARRRRSSSWPASPSPRCAPATEHGRLDPRSADPYGSRAVAELLADRGVSTRVVTTLAEAARRGRPRHHPPGRRPRPADRPSAGATAHGDRRAPAAAPSSSPPAARPSAPSPPASPPTPPPASTRTLSPDCDLPAAQRAGTADTRRHPLHHRPRPAPTRCYPSDGLPTLAARPDDRPGTATPSCSAPPTSSTTTASTSTATPRSPSNCSAPAPIWSGTSPRSADDSPHRRRRRAASSTCSPRAGSGAPCSSSSPPSWPPSGAPADSAPSSPNDSPSRSAPPRPPKAAPASTARPTPATARPRALRSATRTRLAPLVGVPAAQAHAPEALLPALSAHLHRPTDTATSHSLLFGPPPGDDAALISLADQLDALEREVRRS